MTNNATRRQSDPNVFAVLHRVGASWRCLIGRQGARGSQSKPELLVSETLESVRPGSLDAKLDEHSVSEVICVLPAAASICRTCSLPDAPPEHLEPALRLQAEAHLFGIAPPHRLSMAVLEGAPGESTRSGIILAWPESATVEAPPTNRPVTFAPDVAALAALINGFRPQSPLVWLDRSDGSLALAVSHANGVTFRAVREDAEEFDVWRSSVGRVLGETALGVSHTGSFVESMVQALHDKIDAIEPGRGALIAPEEIVQSSASRMNGVPTDASWWAEYGIAAGVMLLHTGPLAALCTLKQNAPLDAPSRIKDTLAKLADAKVAKGLVVACILMVLFAPLVTNWLRVQILELRHSDLDTKLELVNKARESLIIYRELSNDAWPMTKILSDIACNTPEGIELVSVRIQQGGTFSVRGRALPNDGATATEVVVLMQAQLRDSGIFNDINLNWSDPDAYRNYDFELNARFLRPYYQYNYPDELDFGKWTVVDRRDGRGPGSMRAGETPDEDGPSSGALVSGVDYDTSMDDMSSPEPSGQRDRRQQRDAQTDRVDQIAQADPDEPVSSSRVSGSRPTPRPGFGGDASRRDEVVGQGGLAPHQDIPEPLTEGQINAMTEAEVRDMLQRVSMARRAARARNDEELENRLQREFNWLMARMRGGS